MCIFKDELWENVEQHTSQENGFTPMCICICIFTLELSENADLHISQK